MHVLFVASYLVLLPSCIYIGANVCRHYEIIELWNKSWKWHAIDIRSHEKRLTWKWPCHGTWFLSNPVALLGSFCSWPQHTQLVARTFGRDKSKVLIKHRTTKEMDVKGSSESYLLMIWQKGLEMNKHLRLRDWKSRSLKGIMIQRLQLRITAERPIKNTFTLGWADTVSIECNYMQLPQWSLQTQTSSNSNSSRNQTRASSVTATFAKGPRYSRAWLQHLKHPIGFFVNDSRGGWTLSTTSKQEIHQ